MINSIESVPGQSKNMLERSHFWIIAFLILAITLFYYAVQIYWNTVFVELPWVRLFIAREWALRINGCLYFIPLVYSAIIFWWRGTLITWVITLLIIFPHLIAYTSSNLNLVYNLITLSIPLLIVAYINLELKWRERERKELAEREKERQNYLAQVFKAQEDERTRIAQEIHDDSIQELCLIASNINNLKSSKETDDPAVLYQKTESIREMVISVSENLRKLSINLRPAILNDLGLIPALKWMVNRFQSENNIKTQITILGTSMPISEKVSVNIFRIVQEALNNIKKHAEATNVVITVQFYKKVFKVTIQDNGHGFSLPTDNRELMTAGKLGLIGMQKRAQFINGDMLLQSAPEKGTTVLLEINLDS